MSGTSPIAPAADGIVLTVRLTPRGGRDALDGVATDSGGRVMLRARVSAPPEDGAANAALLALLADELDMPKRAVTLASGATQRVKRVHIAGDPTALTTRMRALLVAR